MKKLLALLLMLVSMSVMASPVNVNTADAATLAAALHGIGLKKAQDIVAYRDANGAFKSLEDLGKVKGIGDKTLAKNQADILFSGDSAPIVKAAKKAPAAAEKAAKAPAVPATPATSAVPAPTAVIPPVAKDAKAPVANPLK